MSETLHDGQPVRYFPGFRDGPSRLGKIRSDYTSIGGTPGYYITGAGFISAGHIEALDYRGKTVEVKTLAEAMAVADWDEFEDVVITDNAERIKFKKLMRGLGGL